MAHENPENEQQEQEQKKPYILIEFADFGDATIQRVRQSPSVTVGQMGQAAFRLNVLATMTIMNNVMGQNVQIAQPSQEQMRSILEHLKPQ